MVSGSCIVAGGYQVLRVGLLLHVGLENKQKLDLRLGLMNIFLFAGSFG